ncbi:protein argonaute 4-like [Apium graveolens]|uniref:protein argonaute 4-like n=1 Tax=Apium graveolens TaxID=4045 RepID=UPI003D798C46
MSTHLKLKLSKLVDEIYEKLKEKESGVSVALVALFYEDGHPVDGKGTGRRVLDRVHQTYKMELEGRDFAYDGEKSLFIVVALPGNKLDFTVVLENISSNRSTGNSSSLADESPNENDRKRLKRPYQSKTYKVEISYAGKILVQAIAQALRGPRTLRRP